jgi:hypothetical protein
MCQVNRPLLLMKFHVYVLIDILLSKLTRSVKLEALEASNSQGAIFYFPFSV